MNPLLRELFCWKFVFYRLLLPVLRWLGPACCDSAVRRLGQILALCSPGRREQLRKALKATRLTLALEDPIEDNWLDLAANSARFLARDYPLEGLSDSDFFRRFDVSGEEWLEDALAAGQGAIVVGSHLGGYIAGLHWLARRRLLIRAMVQRPRHVSRELSRWFDETQSFHSQSTLLLRRNLPREEAVKLLFRARAALRDGIGLYICGDIPWNGSNTRPGRLLGRPLNFLAVWIELAMLTQAPVFHVFCTHCPGGRFRLEIDAVGQVRHGQEQSAMADYLRELEARIANDPCSAVAHLLWPCFSGTPRLRLSRRIISNPASTRPGRRRPADSFRPPRGPSD